MKRLLTAFSLALACLVGCSRQTVEKVQPSELSLVSPTGVRLAKSVSDLEKMAQTVLLSKMKSSATCKISNIEYYDVDKGVMAKVEFVSSDGFKSSFLRGDAQITFPKDTKVSFSTSSARLGVPADDDGGGKVTISCSGTQCCTPVYNPSTKESSCKCESGVNNGCSMTVESN